MKIKSISHLLIIINILIIIKYAFSDKNPNYFIWSVLTDGKKRSWQFYVICFQRLKKKKISRLFYFTCFHRLKKRGRLNLSFRASVVSGSVVGIKTYDIRNVDVHTEELKSEKQEEKQETDERKQIKYLR